MSGGDFKVKLQLTDTQFNWLNPRQGSFEEHKRKS